MEIAAIIFILIMLAVGYVVFRILKKTVKLAIRAILLLVIIGVALVGGYALWSASSSDSSRPPASAR